MHPKLLLIVTACVETVAGLCLLSLPTAVFAILLGLEHARVDTILVGRLAGAALFAIGVASWIARADTLTHAHLGLLIGVLSYNATASILLVFAGLILQMTGVLLWPAVALHAVLGIWCLSCLCSDVTAKGQSFWRSTFTLRE
jgi:hypothetical protein